MANDKGKLIVIFGPPAAGKDSVMKGLLRKKELELEKLVTYTSRPRRENELQGYDYHFVTEAKFFDLIWEQEMLEYELHGSDWKGAHKDPFMEILEEGKNYIWRVTPYRGGTLEEFVRQRFEQGISDKLLNKSATIYVGPNDQKILRQRYISRVSNPNISEFEKRFDEDMNSFERFKHKYDHILDNTGTLQETIYEAAAIVKDL